jgi:hypothetical protein
MPGDEEIGFPTSNPDERELLLSVADEDARWTPDDRLISLLGIVNHLTHVEWRHIDCAMLNREVSRSEAEFSPDAELSLDAAVLAYRRGLLRPTVLFERSRHCRSRRGQARTFDGCCCT